MSIFSFISDGISAACSVVGSALSCIGPAVSSFCINVLPKILPFINTISAIADVLMIAFGLFKPSEDIENIGDRAIQAGAKGITPDKFDKFDEYMEAIRNFELDPKRSNQLSYQEKACAGLAVGSYGLDEKFGVSEGTMANLWVLAAIKPDYFNADRFKAILEHTSDIGSVLSYFQDKLGPAQSLDMEKSLVAAERSLSPDKDAKTIYAELDAARLKAQEPPH